MLFREPSFQKSPRIHAGRSVALIVDQIAGLAVIAAAEEVVESHFAESGERGIGGDVTADVRIVLIGADYHRSRIPANQAFDAAFQRAISRIRSFFVRWNRIQVGSVNGLRRRDAESGGAGQKLFEQVTGAIGTGFV